MKNPHIELVKKWLADPKSVSQEELERTAGAAADAAAAADTAHSAADDADDADDIDTARSEFWIEKYEERTQ